jgi:putative flavoprotein involved in K+ transport
MSYRIPRDFGPWVAGDEFVQYLEEYAGHHRLEPPFGVETTRIDHADRHWSVHTTAGTILTRAVVVPTGYTRLPHLPRWPGTFDGPVVHSVNYRNPQPYRDQDVLIVGAALRLPSIWRRAARHGYGSRYVRRRISCGAT